MKHNSITAAIIIIGNEILSGKTQDLNIQFLAIELGNLGIRLKEVRVVPDVERDIIEAVNLLRKKYTYIFTTGGIGPTHDDITAKTIAMAFDDELILNPKAKEKIHQYLISLGREMTQEHEIMAYIPKSATLLLNYETGAPGFKIDNVFVMAGVPYIMQAIFQEAKKHLRTGIPIISKSIEVKIPESVLAEDFSNLQNKYPEIEMGSYPFKTENTWKTNLVLRGDNYELIDKAMDELEQIIKNVSK
ncbi:MAG: molybdopterin-binding protein [Rickettsiales bacterium]